MEKIEHSASPLVVSLQVYQSLLAQTPANVPRAQQQAFLNAVEVRRGLDGDGVTTVYHKA